MMIESAGVKKRISPEDVKNEILSIHYFTAKDGAKTSKLNEQIKNDDETDLTQWIFDGLEQVTFCVLILRNGTKVVGVNHGAIDPAQHSAIKGREEAYKDAENKVWELLGFRLRDKLTVI